MGASAAAAASSAMAGTASKPNDFWVLQGLAKYCILVPPGKTPGALLLDVLARLTG